MAEWLKYIPEGIPREAVKAFVGYYSNTSDGNDNISEEAKKAKKEEEIRKEIKDDRRQMKLLAKKIEKNSKKLSRDNVEYEDQDEADLARLASKIQANKMPRINIGIFGSISTGKSTMVNCLLENELAKVGVGGITSEIKPYKGRDFTVWDAPGENYESNCSDENFISFMKGLTKRLILIQATIKENLKLMHSLDKLHLSYDIIVNKFDHVDQNERDNFRSQIESEINASKLTFMKNVFFVSAKYPNMFPDWKRMVDYLTKRDSQTENAKITSSSSSNSDSSSDSDIDRLDEFLKRNIPTSSS